MTTSTLLIAFLLILMNALYVAAEFAVLGSRVSRVKQYSVEGSALATALLPVVNSTPRLDDFIAVCQVGITFSSLLLGAFGQATFGLALADRLLDNTTLAPLAAHSLAALVVLIVLTSIQVVFGELIPKTVALQYPVRTAMYTLHPVRWSHVVLAPLIGLLNGSGRFILKRLGVQAERSHSHIHAPEEIELLVRESRDGGLMDEAQRVRLQRALQLGRRSVRQIMAPRRRIAGIDLDTPAEQILETVIGSPFTRLIAFRGTLDNVEGYLHTKDVAAALAAGNLPPHLTSLLRPVMTLPSHLTVDRVLSEFRSHQARVALVADGLGEVVGLVSTEDVMRELLGGLSDEFKRDVGRAAPQLLPNGQWRMPGRLPLDELTEWALGAGVDPEWMATEAQTLAGWLIEREGRLPKEGQPIRVGALVFAAERIAGVAIETVLVTREQEAEEHGDG